MTPKFRREICSDFGKELFDKYHNTGELPSEKDIENFLKKFLTEDEFKKVTVTMDDNVAIDFLAKNTSIPFETCKKIVQEGSAAAVGRSSDNNKFVFLLRKEFGMKLPEYLMNYILSGFSAHEMQHLMRNLKSFHGKWNDFIYKYFPKYAHKHDNRAGDYCKMSANIQNQAISKMHDDGNLTKDKMREISTNVIRENLLPDCDTINYYFLKTLKQTIKNNEIYSYEAGGNVETYALRKLKEDGYVSKEFSIQEFTANCYKELWKAIRKQMVLEKINNIKRFFGLKPKDYRIERPHSCPAPSDLCK